MIRNRATCFSIATVLLLGASGARALEPKEVLVVANAKVPGSVSLAQFYVRSRNIPAENLVEVRTTGDYDVTREDYESEIRAPVRKALVQRNIARRIRAICVVWGVPVRVGGDGPTVAGIEGYKTAAEEAHARLMIDYQLLDRVGKSFPDPRTDSLEPVGKLFEPRVNAPAKPYPVPEEILADVRRLFRQKRKLVEKISSSNKRRLAHRQLMALQLDIFGRAGLIDYLRRHDPPEAPDIGDLEEQLKRARRLLEKLSARRETARDVTSYLALLQEADGLAGVLEQAWPKARQADTPPRKRSDATVDSELALLWWPGYDLEGFLKNPLHWKVREAIEAGKAPRPPRVLMACRIDGPSRADSMRLIKAGLAAEEKGLSGKMYIDAGGKLPQYDVHLKNTYRFVSVNTAVPVELDTDRRVFGRGMAPNASLYIGWYSLMRYVPAFSWVPGAVGWHISSFEARDLRDPESRQWCVRMIQQGVSATIGAVDEPFLGTFPLPEEFFPLLLTGDYTVAECYWRTVPAVSWRLTLIADPLYTPFRENPQLRRSALPKGLAP